MVQRQCYLGLQSAPRGACFPAIAFGASPLAQVMLGLLPAGSILGTALPILAVLPGVLSTGASRDAFISACVPTTMLSAPWTAIPAGKTPAVTAGVALAEDTTPAIRQYNWQPVLLDESLQIT